ncbi:MAG: 30S ribosomal protein S17e [Candidatus Bathyarchaeia archaeon]
MKRCFYAYKRRRNIKPLIIGGISLGKVKTEQIKRTGKELMTRFPNKFSSNFDDNKKLVNTLTTGTTTRVRNKVAGYITRTVALSETGSEIEADVDDLEEE